MGWGMRRVVVTRKGGAWDRDDLQRQELERIL